MFLKSCPRNIVLAQNASLLSSLGSLRNFFSLCPLLPSLLQELCLLYMMDFFFSSHFYNGACVSCILVTSSPYLSFNLRSLCDFSNICFGPKFSIILPLWNSIFNENASFLKQKREISSLPSRQHQPLSRFQE